jgi:membrane-associated phospholipid phosphatase
MTCVRWLLRRSRVLVLATVAALCGTPASADSDFIGWTGNVLLVGLPAAGGAYALYTGDRRGFFQIGASVLGAYGVSFGLQHVVRKRAPDPDLSGWNAFPSDSSAVAFAAASAIQVRYGWDYGLPSYAVAAFVGYSRVHVDEHDWGDVAVGALIGWAAGQLLTDPYEEMPQMQVYGDTRGAGINLHWTF